MTEITAPKSAVTAEQFADEIREQLKYTQGVTVEQAKPADVYVAASAAVRRHLMVPGSRPSPTWSTATPRQSATCPQNS